jgi:glyoxylase-like metal-dependent hydrolase (beta-lactamase superfamily II)
VVGGSVRAGETEVVSLVDTEGVLGPYAELFPRVTEHDWARWREPYPELFDGVTWTMPFGAFLVQTQQRTILVDTGVGPAGEGEWMPERQGRLLGELERHGTTPDDVDVVFNTHIHVDHVGWNHAFPTARLLMHRESWELAQERGDRDFVQRSLLGLGDRVETVEGEVELAPEVIAFETPGHLAGHMSVRIGDELLLLGDVAVHPAQLVHADWHYVSDADPKRAEQTRGQVLDAYGDWKLACGHFPAGGFGRLADDGTWTPLT